MIFVSGVMRDIASVPNPKSVSANRADILGVSELIPLSGIDRLAIN